MADELFELRNHFYLRNFQAGINEGGSVQPSTPALTLERDVLIYRCFIGLGNNKMVLDEVSDSAPAELLAIKLLAEYHEAKLLDQSTEPILASLSKQLQEQATQTLLVVGATIYASEGNIDDAIRTANQSTTLEGKSLLVQLYLHINRVDLADKEYAAMVQIDEEATLTQLTGAWIGINKGGDKLQEAFYIFQELGDKYTPGSVILNGQAVCHMQRGAFEDAEGLLLEALEKNSKDAEALANLAVCAQQLGKQPLRFLKQLKVVDSTHPFIVGIENFERSFERQAARYGPSRQ